MPGWTGEVLVASWASTFLAFRNDGLSWLGGLPVCTLLLRRLIGQAAWGLWGLRR